MLNNLPPGPFAITEDLNVEDANGRYVAVTSGALSDDQQRAVATCLILGEKLLRPPEEVRRAMDRLNKPGSICFENEYALARVANYYLEQLKQAGGVDG